MALVAELPIGYIVTIRQIFCNHITMSKQQVNILEKMLYEGLDVSSTALPDNQHRCSRGLFLSISNHKQGTDTLYQSLKKQYKSIVYALTGENISMDCIKSFSGAVPSRRRIMDLVAAKKIIMVAGIHHYNRFDNRTARGSRANFDYQHLHFYLYGCHHYICDDEKSIADALDYLPRVLCRHNNFVSGAKSKRIDVKVVGAGKYVFNDVVNASCLYDYLALPTTEPSKQCVINYIADTIAYDGNKYPLTFIYQEA